MKNLKRTAALGLAALMALGTVLTGCGSSSGDSASTGTEGGSTEFSFTLAMPDETWAFDTWDDSPAVQEWIKDCGYDISFDWNEAPTSASSDFYNTLIATGEYTDILETSLLSQTVKTLYTDGLILDLTDLVEENMPNYMAWLDAHPDYKDQLYTTVDGEKKILQIYAVNETNEPWSGFLYRRDWIVEYGTNPTTGEAFTGGYTDDAKTEWEDDVVFPSGETYPKTISDWEWMFEIFNKAIAANGIANDGNSCAVEMMYRGYYGGQGSLLTSFGGTFCGYQVTRDGDVEYGWTDSSDAIRAYCECLNSWYEDGYMDQTFDERSSDSIFFMVNQAGVYGGEVGMWYGLIDSQLGNMMNTGDGNALLDNICTMVAPQPINDKYGDASVQNVDPWHYFEAGSLLGGSIVLTEKAADKDIATLLKAIDYLYTEEGCGLSTLGVSYDQQAEGNYQAMTDLGLDGAYELTTDEEGNTVWDVNADAIASDVLAQISLNRLCIGLNPNSREDKHNSAMRQDALEKACLYPGGGDIAYLSNNLDSDQASEKSTIETNISTILDVEIPNFITGRTEINDDTWASFQESLLEQNPDSVTEYLKALQ